MKKTGRPAWRLLGLAALAASFVWLGGGRASASEFEIVADSFTVANQVNVSSVSYFNTRSAPPANPASATQLTTPGGLYFDGTFYKVWDNNAGAWVKLATGTAVSGAITGSGTAGTVSRWTAGGVLGDSAIQDDGTLTGIGTAPAATYQLKVGGVNAQFANSGYVDILGLTVGKAAGITTLYSGTGTATPIARIK